MKGSDRNSKYTRRDRQIQQEYGIESHETYSYATEACKGKDEWDYPADWQGVHYCFISSCNSGGEPSGCIKDVSPIITWFSGIKLPFSLKQFTGQTTERKLIDGKWTEVPVPVFDEVPLDTVLKLGNNGCCNIFLYATRDQPYEGQLGDEIEILAAEFAKI